MRTQTICLAVALVCLPASTLATSLESFVSQGSLLANREGKVVKVPLKHTRVRISVSGYLAETTVTQEFDNPHQDKIEAIYAFPLPSDSAIWSFALRSGDRTIQGKILERERARAIFRRASLAGQVAALLTQERPNLFTQKVANLLPRKPVVVTLRYVSRLRYDAGAYELVFPMVVGPRFVVRDKDKAGRPRLLSPPVLPPNLRSAHDIDLQVEVEAGVPIASLACPSHRLRVDRPSRSSASARIDAGDRIPNRDFILRYRVDGKRPAAAVIAHRGQERQPGALLLMVQPPAAKRMRPVPRELIFVLDTSSSMTGAPLQAAKRLVRRFVKGLGPQDTFQIVRFSDGSSSLGPSMIANRPGNVKLALTWLDRLRARGGTWVQRGLETAFGLPHDPERLRMVVFVSDGYIGNEDQVLGLLQRRLGSSRVFALGVGTAVNRYLLEEMATLGRGLVRVVRPDELVERTVDELYVRISRPLLTDLTVEFRGVKVASLTPKRLPDLFEGEPLFLHGLYRTPGKGTVVVHGRRQGALVKLEIPVALPRHDGRHRAVALSWARARIAELERRLLRGDDETVRKQVLELSLRYGILTRHTAFVAVDEDSFTGTDQAVKVRVPVDRPQMMARSAGVLGLMGSGAGGGSIGLGGLGTVGHGGGGGTGYGAALIGVRAAAPRVMAGRAEVRGALDKEILRRIIRRHINEVRYCYEKGRSTTDKGGRVQVAFVIEASGRVVSSEVESSTLGNAAVERCVASAVRRWEFPKINGGGVVVVHYPFVFRLAEPERPTVIHER